MPKLQQLLDEKWPLHHVPSIVRMDNEVFRRIFTEGYNAAKEENLKHYGNTLLVSVASKADEDGEVASDFMLEGEAEKIGSALACQMQRHPELIDFIEYSLSLYDNLISHDQNVNDHE